MSRKNQLILFAIICSSLITTILFPENLIIIEKESLKLSSITDNGTSKYQIKQSVTYQVEINFSIQQISGSGNYYVKLPRLNDRQPNSLLTPMCPPYQESILLYNKISGYIPTEILLDHTDKFNNTYDSFNASLNFENPEVKLSSKYLVTLNEIAFENILPSDIETYNYSDDIFGLYCNKSETFYNKNDTNLISLSNSIVNPSDNPITKAQKIINWISNNIVYNDSLDVEIGASSAYGNLTGDCSEFSSLMITLLRIQGIPARKVTGFCVSNINNFKPEIGDIYTFYSRYGESPTLLGHAWIEYYVPNIGWIACDPTWYQVTHTYFNRIDYLRFNYNIGAWFFFPPDEMHSEFPVPYATGFFSGAYTYEFEFKVTVIDTNYLGIDPLVLIIIVVITAVVIISITSLVIVVKKKRKPVY
jgi:transglutaminase-like putative cysteine protease